MKIICTGISGCAGHSYLNQVEDFAELNDTDLKVYNVGEMMFDIIKECGNGFEKKNILNLPKPQITAWINHVYDRIASDMENHEHIIIKTHASFYWNKVLYDSKNARFIDRINADRYVTLINTPKAILRNYAVNMPQWKEQNLTAEEIMDWQNTEAVITANHWAEARNKRHLAIPRNQPPETLFKYLVNPEMPLVYASFPMTQLEHSPTYKESEQKISDFIAFLREYFVVLDPRTIEVDMAGGDKEKRNTSHRDIDWFVSETDITACYFPELVHSSGALTEIGAAKKSGKDVWLTIPKSATSPFDDENCTRFFNSLENLMEFVEANYKKYKLKR